MSNPTKRKVDDDLEDSGGQPLDVVSQEPPTKTKNSNNKYPGKDDSDDSEFTGPSTDEKKEEESALALKTLKQVYQLCSAKNLSQETKLKDITKIITESELLKKMVIPKSESKSGGKSIGASSSSGSSKSLKNKKKAAKEEAKEEGTKKKAKKGSSRMTPEERKAYLKREKILNLAYCQYCDNGCCFQHYPNIYEDPDLEGYV